MDLSDLGTSPAEVGCEALKSEIVEFMKSETRQAGKNFEVTLELQEFQLDPSLADMKDKLPSVPFGFVVESVWCHTLDKQAGLEISEVELAAAVDDASQ